MNPEIEKLLEDMDNLYIELQDFVLELQGEREKITKALKQLEERKQKLEKVREELRREHAIRTKN